MPKSADQAANVAPFYEGFPLLAAKTAFTAVLEGNLLCWTTCLRVNWERSSRDQGIAFQHEPFSVAPDQVLADEHDLAVLKR